MKSKPKYDPKHYHRIWGKIQNNWLLLKHVCKYFQQVGSCVPFYPLSRSHSYASWCWSLCKPCLCQKEFEWRMLFFVPREKRGKTDRNFYRKWWNFSIFLFCKVKWQVSHMVLQHVVCLDLRLEFMQPTCVWSIVCAA